MYFELTAEDLLILEKLRLERLQRLFSETLPNCLMQVNCRNHLIIHCATPMMVDQLLSEIDQLREYSQMILGVQRLSIWFAQQEVYRTMTQKTPRRVPQRVQRLRSH